MNGSLELSSTYEEEWPLYPAWMDDSCRHASLDLTKASYWKGQVVIMIAWVVLSVIGLQVFYRRREQPIFKFRGWANVALFALGCTAFFVYSSLEAMADGSFPLKGQAYIYLTLSAYISMHYIVKAIQLLFVYHWNRAKVESTKLQSYAALKRYKFLSFVLDHKFYFIACGIGALLLGIVPAVIVTQQNRSLDSNNVEYASVRCNWFQIPEEYTSATSNSSACACVNSYFLKESAYVSGCDIVLSSCSSTVNNVTDLVTEFCNLCSSAYDENCTSWLYNTFTSGECGFPSRVPFFSSCVASVFADTLAISVINFISFGLTFTNVVLIIPLLRMKDCLGMTTEILIGLSLCFAYYILYFLLPYVWNNSYPSTLFSVVICTWMLLIVPLYFPLFLDWHRKSFGEKPIENLNLPSIKPRQLGSVNTMKIHEREFDTCISTPALLSVYESFTVQEFTAESLRFLVDYKRLVEIADELEYIEEARRLTLRFIDFGSVMEINISDKVRTKIIATMGQVGEAPDSESNVSKTTTDRAEILATLASDFESAYEQIRLLVITSSWPNFRRSSLFDKYQAIEHQIFTLDNRVNPLWPEAGRPPSRKTSHVFKDTKLSTARNSMLPAAPPSPTLLVQPETSVDVELAEEESPTSTTSMIEHSPRAVGT